MNFRTPLSAAIPRDLNLALRVRPQQPGQIRQSALMDTLIALARINAAADPGDEDVGPASKAEAESDRAGHACGVILNGVGRRVLLVRRAAGFLLAGAD